MEAVRGSRGRGRVRLAVATALGSTLACVLLVALASPGAHAGAPALLPDLVTLGISRHDIVVEKRGKHRFLRLSNTIGNQGTSPLDIVSAPPGPDCDDDGYDAVQRFFVDSNTNGHYDEGDQMAEPGDWLHFGCMRFHDAPGHLHWHVLDFARYQLRRAKTGRLVESKKVGFCVIDTEPVFTGLDGFPEKPQYPEDGTEGCGGVDEKGNATAPESEGLSIGWADVYFFGLPGQSMEISGLRRGRYCLISKADPTNLIAEANDANNTHTVRLKLRPRKLRFKKLPGPCQL